MIASKNQGVAMMVEGRMIDVEQWEKVRRGYYVEGKSVRQLMRETGHSFRTIRRILAGNEPGRYVLKNGRAAPVLGAYKAQGSIWIARSRGG
jgi:hypothetical protein